MAVTPPDDRAAPAGDRAGRLPARPAQPPEPRVVQPPEQLRYARWLEAGARVGLAVLVVTFGIYALGLASPHVPVHRLPELWVHPAARFIELSGSPSGWGWLARIHQADIAGLAGIAVLAGCSVPALLALVAQALQRGDRALAWLCVAEVAVVLLAASGLLTGAH